MLNPLYEQKCDLSWLNRPYKCSTKNKDEIEQYAKDCNLDLNLFKTKADRCRELYKKQNPDGSIKKVRTSPKKSSKKANPNFHKCDLSWLNRPYKCSTKNKDEIEQYAKDCNLDLNLFKTKADRCRELYKKQNPDGGISKKSSIKKSIKKSRKPRIPKAKTSSIKKSSIKKSSIKPKKEKSLSPPKLTEKQKFKIVKFKPYEEENDIFYNQKKIVLKYVDSSKIISTIKYKPTKLDSDYVYLYGCITNKDAKSFREFIQKNPETNIFYYPEGKIPLLEAALYFVNQEIIDIIYDLEMKYRNRGKSTCYHLYSDKYIKLIESLSTDEKPVDFYIEEWLFQRNYNQQIYRMKTIEKDPIQLLFFENCFWNRKNRDKEPCLYPNIRWQSGDPRKIDISNRILISIRNVIEAFLKDGNLYLEEFKTTLKEVIPFLELFKNEYGHAIDFDIKNFIENNVLFKKEFNKQDDKDLFLIALQKYVSGILLDKPNIYIKKFIEIGKNDTFPKFKKGIIDNQSNLRYDYVELLKKKKTSKNIKKYNFCMNLLNFMSEIIFTTIFILDVYTILRIFKQTDVKPYFVYCYFGSSHITNLLYFFVNILGWYKIVINKPDTNCTDQDITENKKCRCISFNPQEYVENSKEIRQLSGPVSFYKLEAINKNTRPYYINLFGDRHGSERGQCKECNFDYLQYYRNKFASNIN